MASRHDSLPEDSLLPLPNAAATLPTASPLCCYSSHTNGFPSSGCDGSLPKPKSHISMRSGWALHMFQVTSTTIVLQSNSSTHFASVPATPRSGVHSKFAAQASAAADVIVNALAHRHNRQPHPAAAPHPGPPALRCMGLEAWSWTHHPTSRPVTQCACAPTIARVSKLIPRKPIRPTA